MFNKKTIFNSVLPLILILLSVISHFPWLNSTYILTNGDVWFLYREAMLTSNWGTWISHLSLGEVNVSYNLFILTFMWQLIARLGFSYQVANQIVYFFPIIFVTPLAIYFYLKLMTSHHWASFIGSLVYLFTPFFLMMQTGGLLFAVAYTLLPLQFYFLEKYLRSQKTTDGLCLIFVVSIALFYELRVVYISIFIFIFYILFYHISLHRKNFFKPFMRLILRSLPLISSLLLINAYIYLPLIFSSIKESASGVATRGLFGANFFTIREPFVLMHPFWTGKVPSEFIPQPIPFYFWIFPLFAFAALFFVKKEKNIIFFTGVALAMIFLGKSSSDPLGGIYTWLYYNFPGFGFFREPSKFWIMLCFSYSVLIVYTISYSLDALKRARKKWSITYGLFSLPIIFLIITVFIVGKPAFTTELGSLFKPLTVTKEHYAVKDFIANQQDFFRTYYIPGRYRMGYWSEIHPMLGLNEVANQFQTLDPRVLSLLSVKYVIVPPDITNDVYRIWGSKQVYEKQAEIAAGLKKINNPAFGSFDVYENVLPYKSYIYSPSELTYVAGSPSDLLNVLPLVLSQNSALYFESQEKANNKDRQKVINIEKSQAYNASEQIIALSRCIRCEERNYREGLVYPYIKILPQSLLYKFIINRERKKLQSAAQDPRAQLQLAVFYGAKRMAELQKLEDGNYPSQLALPVLKEQDSLVIAIEDGVRKSVDRLDNDSLFYIYDYIDIQTNIARTFLTTRYLDAENKAQLERNYKKLKDLLNLIYDHLWVSDDQNNRYYLSIEKEGDYQFFSQSLSDEENINIDDTSILLTKSDKRGWITDRQHHLTKGMHKITIPKPKSLITAYPEKTLIPKDKKSQEIEIAVEGIEDNVTYELSFNYKASENTQIRSYLERDTDFIQEGIIRRTSDRYLMSDNRWSSVSNDQFQSRFGERKILLKFIITKPLGSVATLDIKNLQFIKTTSPLFAAVQSKQATSKAFKNPVMISYQWINPTKYLVHISNANNPFFLVLNESYHNSWEASYVKNNIKDDDATVVSKKENVTELIEKNDLDLFSFASIFYPSKKIQPHFPINSYANAWYLDKKGEYTITVEFAPQKIFTLSLFISGISFCFALIWLIYLKLKK